MSFEKVVASDMDISNDTLMSIMDYFSTLKKDIRNAVEREWLPYRTLMYICDIEDMFINLNSIEKAADGINTVIDDIRENEYKSPTQHISRDILARLGELQSKLYSILY